MPIVPHPLAYAFKGLPWCTMYIYVVIYLPGEESILPYFSTLSIIGASVPAPEEPAKNILMFFSLHNKDTFLLVISAVEYKNALLLVGFWNILKILKTTFILALCSPLPNSASGCCGSFYTSTGAAAHCHTSLNIQQWRRRRQRSAEAASKAQKPKCSLRSCSPRMKLWSQSLTTLVSFVWLLNSMFAYLSIFMLCSGKPSQNALSRWDFKRSKIADSQNKKRELGQAGTGARPPKTLALFTCALFG